MAKRGTEPISLPIEALVEAYRSGETVDRIAARYGVSTQTANRRLRAAGVEIRPRSAYRGYELPERQQQIDPDRLRAMAAAGQSCREMATALGCSEECVRERMVRLGIPRLPAKARPERNVFWRGGRTVDADGYVLVKSPDHPHATKAGYVREHRLAMERELGRYLLPTEVVDHIDGDRGNNDPANLRVFASNAEHLRATLEGRVPNWTPDGRRRIREGHLGKHRAGEATPASSGADGSPLR